MFFVINIFAQICFCLYFPEELFSISQFYLNFFCVFFLLVFTLVFLHLFCESLTNPSQTFRAKVFPYILKSHLYLNATTFCFVGNAFTLMSRLFNCQKILDWVCNVKFTKLRFARFVKGICGSNH